MNKIERFYNSLGEPTEANNGDFGYFVTVGDLVKNGGNKEFFRKVRKSDKKVSKAVFYGLEYDRTERAYFGHSCYDISKDSGPLKKQTLCSLVLIFNVYTMPLKIRLLRA